MVIRRALTAAMALPAWPSGQLASAWRLQIASVTTIGPSITFHSLDSALSVIFITSPSAVQRLLVYHILRVATALATAAERSSRALSLHDYPSLNLSLVKLWFVVGGCRHRLPT